MGGGTAGQGRQRQGAALALVARPQHNQGVFKAHHQNEQPDYGGNSTCYIRCGNGHAMAGEKSSFTVYKGLVPISPYTTPKRPGSVRRGFADGR